MPSVNISIYFNDRDYQKYQIIKEDINKKVREIIKKEIEKWNN